MPTIIQGQDPVFVDDLFNSDNTTVYDWLLSPSRNPVPALEMEEQKPLTSHNLLSNGQSTSPDSGIENLPADTTSSNEVLPKLPAALSSNCIKSCNSTVRRPSPSRKALSVTKPLRSSTPTSRAATKPFAPSKRSITPTPRSTTLTTAPKPTFRSSTPTPKIASAKSVSRSSTPTQRPSGSANLSRSRSETKARASSASVKSRPSKNLPNVKQPVIETNMKAIPTRGLVSNGCCLKSGITRSRGYSNVNDDEVNPVLMGTKMVERVVNMRKLAPPRQEQISNQNFASGKLSVSQDSSGFGRSLSKKSFDMALRHLDIRRSMPANMRATVTKVPASSVHSVSQVHKIPDHQQLS